MAELLSVPQGDFELTRLPERRNEVLRAWDAADEYVLEYVAEQASLGISSKLILLNDSFGALAVALSSFNPYAVSDSYLSQAATRRNLRANNRAETTVSLLTSLQIPAGPWDVVVIKIPKTLAFLEDLLIRLKPQLTPDTQIILGGMVKHMPPTITPLLERLIGPTQASLAKKKARLLFTQVNPHLITPNNPYPSRYELDNSPYTISNHANVFARAQLDIGTRFFLAHLPQHTAATTIVDLGCGNGVLGLMAAASHPHATLIFIDESYMAVASAKDNFQAAFNGTRSALFLPNNGLEHFPSNSVDLILCNPPFHQQQTVGDQLATALFHQAKHALAKRGSLWVVGNRHLGYQSILQRLFGQCTLVAANQKFVILRAERKNS